MKAPDKNHPNDPGLILAWTNIRFEQFPKPWHWLNMVKLGSRAIAGRVEVLPASKSHVKVGSLVTACGSQ